MHHLLLLPPRRRLVRVWRVNYIVSIKMRKSRKKEILTNSRTTSMNLLLISKVCFISFIISFLLLFSFFLKKENIIIDEEIDEDGAFNSEDEEQFQGLEKFIDNQV